MRRFFPKICIPRTLENELVIKQVIPGTVLSILFGVALSCYLIMEMQTNNQLLSLNVKLKTLKFDVETKKQILEQLKNFNEDLLRNVHSYDKNFAQIAEGASVETFYGQELHSLRHHEGDGGIFQTIISDLRALFGLSRSYACNLLSAELDPLKYVQFKGHRAGVVIRMVAPVAIHTVVYDHVLTDLRDSRLSRAAPRTMNVYGISNVTVPPTFLGKFTLKLNRKTHHQQAILHLEPHAFYQHIRFDIVSNHGHPDHTTAYRLSVFGNAKPDS